MPGLTAEVVANSNSQILVLSQTAASNQVSNGSGTRIVVGGFTSPGTFGSSSIQPAVILNVYVGANGTSADPLVISSALPPTPTGQFIFDALVITRANAKSAGAAANGIYTGLVIHPVPLTLNAAANGNVNAAFSASNTANISVYAVASGGGPGASLVVETAHFIANV